MKAFAYRISSSLLISRVGKLGPSDGEWSDYMAEVSKARAVERILVLSDGGGPNSSQRKALFQVMKDRKLRAAIVSASPLVYAVFVALSRILPGAKAFRPNNLVDAFAYLGLNEAEIALALQSDRELSASLGLKPISEHA